MITHDGVSQVFRVFDMSNAQVINQDYILTHSKTLSTKSMSKAWGPH